jgi:fructokinase
MNNKVSIVNQPISNTILGTGLIALDAVLNGKPDMQPQYFAGGSCGNVLTILSYMGWDVYPIARLSNNIAGRILLDDFIRWNVKKEFVSTESDGSTPIIIHRILKDKNGTARHRFEFRDPVNGSYLPSYKAVLAATIKNLEPSLPKATLFYFDRVNRASIDLAKKVKQEGGLVFFEPSNMKEEKLFLQALEYTDIIKYSHERLPEYNRKFKTPKVQVEIETRGEDGLVFRTMTSPSWKEEKSFYIKKIADSAGAGDWCTSGIIHHLFYNQAKQNSKKFVISRLRESLKFGQALGALNCLFYGARGMMYHLTKEQQKSYVTELIKKGYVDLNPQNNLLIEALQLEITRPIASIL